MKKMRRIIVLILALIMVSSMVSCTKEKDEKENTNQNVPSYNGDEDTSNDRDDLPAEVCDLGGMTISIYSLCQQFAANEFKTDDTSTVIGQAVFLRNSNVQDRLNCTIEVDEIIGDPVGGTAYNHVNNMVMAGETDTGNHIINTASMKMVSMSMNGMFADLNTLQYMDLGKNYYSQGYNEALSFGNSQYCVTGKFTLSYYRYMIATFINKEMFEERKVELPYQVVRDGKWTFEYMAQLTKNFYEDLGVGGAKDAEDILGFAGYVGPGSSQTDGYMSSSNLRVMKKDMYNHYVFDIDREAFSNAIDKVYLLYNSDGAFVSKDFNNEMTVEKFGKGEVAMINYRMYVVEQADIRASKVATTYGILPLPKSDENQENYYSYVQDQCFLWGIPKLYEGDMLQKIGIFIEAYASESYRTTKNAYYEVALTGRYVNDTDSIEMLAIMDSTVYVDPVNMFNNNGDNSIHLSTNALREVYASGSNTVINTIEKYINSDTQIVENINKAFKNIEK